MHAVLKCIMFSAQGRGGSVTLPSGRGRLVTTFAGSGVRTTGVLKCAVEMGKDGYVRDSFV